MQQLSPLRPLSKLCSIKSMREVDSPQSEYQVQSNHTDMSKSTQQVTNMYSALQFSIDDLFSKIEKITSQFNYSNEVCSLKVIPDQENQENIPLKKSFSSKNERVLHQYNFNVRQKEQQPKYDLTKKISIRQQFEIVPIIFENKPLLQNKPIKIQDFQLGKHIGSGKFGDVLQCKHKASGTLYALKKIFKSTIKQYGMVQQFTQQLKIHYRLNHPNIVKLYTHFEDQYHIFLLMQYLDGGMLMNFIKKQQKFVSNMVLQVFRAVQYLHRNQIAHRDIKPENIVLSNGVAKLCDFGWAADCQNGMKNTFCGTLDYVSPEVLEEKQYSLDVDLWSLGILIFELLTGFPPFQQQLTKLKMQKIKNFEKNGILFPPHLSNEARDIISRLVKKDPNERMKIWEAYNHPFIRKHIAKEGIVQDMKIILG